MIHSGDDRGCFYEPADRLLRAGRRLFARDGRAGARFLLAVLATAALFLPAGAASAWAGSSVTLRWEANREPDLAGYKLYYRLDSYDPPFEGRGADQGASPITILLADMADPARPEFKLTGLKPNRVYFFVVTAFDNQDPPRESALSNICSNFSLFQPQDGFRVNRNNFRSVTVSGMGLPRKNVKIVANGVTLGATRTDAGGFFSRAVDFSALGEGPVVLSAVMQGVASLPAEGIYDITPPRVTGAHLSGDFITLTFSEANLQHATREANYRFSPSLNFRTAGGADDVAAIDAFSYRLALKGVPRNEVITLRLDGIKDVAGNPLVPGPITFNDDDLDAMADDWESANGLDAGTADGSRDPDGDGFTNYQEFSCRSDPRDAASAPLAIRDTIPQNDSGIVNDARVPADTAFAVLIESANGIDTTAADSIRFDIDDGVSPVYTRNLADDTVRLVRVDNPGAATSLLWAVYDRALETFGPLDYPADGRIEITVRVRDAHKIQLPPAGFSFRVESQAAGAAADTNLPRTVALNPSDPALGGGYDSGIEVIAGPLAGARIVFNSRDPLTPFFGAPDALAGAQSANIQAVGRPLNLQPQSVFSVPVKIFIPCPAGTDVSRLAVCYFNGARWQAACGADGRLLAGGIGWMKPGSRVDHNELNPPAIELQVYHFSGAQAGVVNGKDDSNDDNHDRNGSYVYASCFIAAAGGGLPGWPWLAAGFLAVAAAILGIAGCRRRGAP